MNKRNVNVVLLFLILCTIACSEKKEESQAEKVIPLDPMPIKPSIEGQVLKVVDPRKSIVKWKGTERFRASGHEGTMTIKEGTLTFKNDSLIGGRIVVDMNSIKVTDIPAHDTVPIRNLTNHLKIEFNTGKHPTAEFTITEVDHLGGNDLRIWGNMSINGVTKNIAIPASIQGGEQQVLETRFMLNRFKWNVGKDGSWFEKNLVDEDFELNVDVHVLR